MNEYQTIDAQKQQYAINGTPIRETATRERWGGRQEVEVGIDRSKDGELPGWRPNELPDAAIDKH